MGLSKLLINLLIIDLVISCNNLCNRHGICSTRDKCICYPGWGGADCSLRACPYSEAFVDVILGDLNHDGSIADDQVKTEWYPDYGQIENLGEYGRTYRHMYAECSNAGICNRNTGDCECFAGYEGSACQRRSCPKSSDGAICSSHGVCIPGYKEDATASKNAWELRKFYKCRCDDGYTGYDCSERTCQMGVDPMVNNNMYMKYIFSLPHNHTEPKTSRELAETRIPDRMVPFYFDIEFNGVKYVSPFISSRTIGQICTGTVETVYNKTIALNFQEEIRRALQTLPPISQSSVTLSCNRKELNTTDPHKEDNLNKVLVTISVEYTDYDAFKSSKLLVHEMYDGEEVKSDEIHGDDLSTNKPYHTESDFVTTKDSSGKTYLEEVVTEAIKEYPSGSLQTKECSGRGKCNKSTGLCECFYGYYGSACNMQLKLAV